jgi:hypothetical protein
MYRELSEKQILLWADAYHYATGKWPTKKSGPIAGTVCETWEGVHRALKEGQLGLPGGSSLPKFLAEHRGVRCATYTPPLSEEEVLAWADAHHRDTGDWPTTGSGRVHDVHNERWNLIDQALRDGARGLPGGSSLPRLLADRRGARNQAELPPLTIERILAWADAFHERTGKWPNENSGAIPDSGGETWCGVETSLQKGARGLPGDSSLPRLFAQHRGVRNKTSLPKLTESAILAWADAHHQRTGEWPHVLSGEIHEAPDETWSGINAALENGRRGLSGGTTLAKLLAAHLGVRNHMDLPPILEEEILAWADAHFQQTGDWPGQHSGKIPEAPGETWLRVETALRDGTRGLPGGSSLAQLLAEHRGKRNLQRLPPLRIKKIVAWAEAYHKRTGKWPSRTSGEIPEAPGENWCAVDTALKDALRGLPGEESLAKLLARKCGKRNSKDLPPLTVEEVLAWADRYREQHGDLPIKTSGAIPGTVGDTWFTVDRALCRGQRGLPKGSLAQLLAEHRGKRNLKGLPPLSQENIRLWAEAYRRSNGRLPGKNSGAIPEAQGETWMSVDGALRAGKRGLPGGSSLAQFLAQNGRAPAQ